MGVLGMAGMKLTKYTEEHAMFREYWLIVQKYWIVEYKKSYWESLIDEIGKFTDKFKNKFALELAAAFYETQEYKYKVAMREIRTRKKL